MVGATCQPLCTKHCGLLRVFAFSIGPTWLIHTFSGDMPMLIMSRHISWARPQQPSSGYMKGMHGGGTVRGLQVVAAMASNTCWARAREMQRKLNHHQGHQRQRQISTSQRIGHGHFGSGGSGKGGSGGRSPSGPGVKPRTSMMLCAS